MYTDFAKAYDTLMQDVDYEKWAENYKNLISLALVQGNKCLECASGSGKITIPLKKMGLNMTGSDLSEDMLLKAQENARKEGVFIPFVKMDMCNIKVPSKVDVVLSTCDGVNYLLTKKKLNEFFASAFSALKKKGVLLFDLSTPHKLMNVLGNDTRTYVDENYAYIWNNKKNVRTQTVQMALTIFVKDKAQYERIEEVQTQRAFTREELKEGLLKAGFENIRFFSNMTQNSAREKDMRWHVLAKKP